MHGHALGASGALEPRPRPRSEPVVPPTANFIEPDPECPLDCVPNEAREAEVRVALSSSFAFGGLNAVLGFAAPSS
jgi:nodulation protein E